MTSKNPQAEKTDSASISKPRKKSRSNVIPFPVNYRMMLNVCEWPQLDISSHIEGQYKALPGKKPKE